MTNSRSVVLLAVATEDTKRTASTRGIAARREPKRGRTDSRESERLDSTGDVGELAAQRGPGGGKRDVTLHNRCWELRRVLRNLNNVSTKQHRIAELAKRSPELVFTSLAHLIDLDSKRIAAPVKTARWESMAKRLPTTKPISVPICNRCWSVSDRGLTEHHRCVGCGFRKATAAKHARLAFRRSKTMC